MTGIAFYGPIEKTLTLKIGSGCTLVTLGLRKSSSYSLDTMITNVFTGSIITINTFLTKYSSNSSKISSTHPLKEVLKKFTSHTVSEHSVRTDSLNSTRLQSKDKILEMLKLPTEEAELSTTFRHH